jgi:hypothetical protein
MFQSRSVLDGETRCGKGECDQNLMAILGSFDGLRRCRVRQLYSKTRRRPRNGPRVLVGGNGTAAWQVQLA